LANFLKNPRPRDGYLHAKLTNCFRTEAFENLFVESPEATVRRGGGGQVVRAPNSWLRGFDS